MLKIGQKVRKHKNQPLPSKKTVTAYEQGTWNNNDVLIFFQLFLLNWQGVQGIGFQASQHWHMLFLRQVPRLTWEARWLVKLTSDFSALTHVIDINAEFAFRAIFILIAACDTHHNNNQKPILYLYLYSYTHRRTTAMLVTSNGQVASSSCPLLYSYTYTYTLILPPALVTMHTSRHILVSSWPGKKSNRLSNIRNEVCHLYLAFLFSIILQ